MQNDVEKITKVKERICRPEEAVELHSLELLLEIAEAVLEAPLKGEIVSKLKNILEDEIAKGRKK